MRHYWLAPGLLSVACVPAVAAPLTPGDVLVAVAPTSQAPSTLAEFTPTGTLVQKWTMDAGAISGIAVDEALNPYVYLGNFTPMLWRPNLPSIYLPGLSNAGNSGAGSLAAYGPYLFATDFNTGSAAGGNTPAGIVRFDVNNGALRRAYDPFPNGTDTNPNFHKVVIGLDGRLYASRNHGSYYSSDLMVADPVALDHPTVFTAPVSTDDFAVAANGDFFVVDADGVLRHYDAAFHPIKSLNLAAAISGDILRDIDFTPAGSILLNTQTGKVILSDTNLTFYTSFDAAHLITPGSAGNAATASAVFVQTPVGAPEPSATLSLACAASAAMLGRRRQPIE